MNGKKPYKKGDTVKVVSLADDTALPEFLGKTGTVTGFNTNRSTGNTLKDPLIRVNFPDGTKDEFWQEELQKTEIINF